MIPAIIKYKNLQNFPQSKNEGFSSFGTCCFCVSLKRKVRMDVVNGDVVNDSVPSA